MHTKLILLASAAAPTLATATVIDIDSATFSASPNEIIQSITVEGTTYSSLTGATVSNTSASSEYYYDTIDPGSENAALTGLTATTGTLNTSNGTNFFIYTDGGATTLNSTDVLFLFEYDFSTDNNAQRDDVTLGLIDSSGSLIGDYLLNLVDVGEDAPASLLDTGPLTRESGSSFLNENLYGTTFSIADFSGTTGNVSDAVGIQIIDNNPGLGDSGGGIDITAVGLATIPEPGTFALLAGFLGLTAVMTKRRK